MIVAGAIASVLGLATALVALGTSHSCAASSRRGALPLSASWLSSSPAAPSRSAAATRRVRALPRRLARQAAGGACRRSRRTPTARCSSGSAGRSGRTIRSSASAGRARRSPPTSSRISLPRPRSLPGRGAARALSAPDRRYGVQNVWVQALADLGIVGFAHLLVAVFGTAAWLAALGAVAYGSATALIGLAWTAPRGSGPQGFIAGIPLDALTWLGFGLAATERVLRVSGRLDPSRTSVQYAVRRPLIDWLRAQDVRGQRVLDVGAATGRTSRCSRRDRDDRVRRARKQARRPPRLDRRDPRRGRQLRRVVLCLQVLEHVPDPLRGDPRAAPGGAAGRPRASHPRRLPVSPEPR